jgi:hypothetical protein
MDFILDWTDRTILKLISFAMYDFHLKKNSPLGPEFAPEYFSAELAGQLRRRDYARVGFRSDGMRRLSVRKA